MQSAFATINQATLNVFHWTVLHLARSGQPASSFNNRVTA
jgi:hypothetical protein